jgi:PGF-pre-PGF domain-containing protein
MGRHKSNLLLFCALFLCIALLAGISFAKQGENKEQERIEKKIKLEGEAKVIIVLEENPPNINARSRRQARVSSNDVAKALVDAKRISTINAFAGTLTEGKLEELQASGQNFKIYEDRTLYITKPVETKAGVDSTLATATAAIGANYSWTTLNITGRNVTVAVIDTGIDYTHTALGGCLGIGCRVRDGYDFYNEDSNPLDDHGHGTHVAGIIGANGSIKGVAPEVSFFALKACSSGGSCATSDILQAIDWAVANNSDVISMSIGAFVSNTNEGNSGKDVLSLAIDAAVNQGVVVVISAGNDGPGVSTINAPGSAEKAITVGAVNDASTVTSSDDTIASFSSRGPGAFGRLDPEISAPGVNIISTIPGETTGAQSGTSMAAPFVSGAAALLIEQSRNRGDQYSPAEVRSILISTSKNISGKLFERGTGLLDLQSAMDSRVSVVVNYTSQYSLNTVNDRWEFLTIRDETQRANITINNSERFNITFISAPGNLENMENALVINASHIRIPSSFSVANGTSYTVQVNFTLDNFDQINATTYGGVIVFNGTMNNGSTNLSRVLRIPVVVTVPLHVQASSVYLQRSMINPPTSGGDFTDEDVYFYAVYNPYSRNTTFRINWSSSSDDLDLYAYNSTGDYFDRSALGSGISESVNTANTDSIKWFRVDGFDFTAPITFSMNATDYSSPLSFVSYTPSNLSFFIEDGAIVRFNQSILDASSGGIYYYWSVNNSFRSNSSNFTFSAPIQQHSNFTIDFLASTSLLNNRTNLTLRWNISLDGVNPTLSIFSPSPLVNASVVELRYTRSDDFAGIDECWYSLQGAANVSISNCDNISIHVPNGLYNITVYANDSAGNIGSATASFRVNDTLEPVISNSSPSSALSSSTTFATLFVNTNENATCKYSLTDVSYDNMTSNFTDSFTNHSASYAVAAGSSYVLYVKCSDMNNNSNVNSSTISFSVAAAASVSSSGGGGGGGGGGGAGPAKPNNRNTVIQSAAVIKTSYALPLTSTQIPISEINLSVNSEVRNVKFTVSKVKTLEDKPAGEVYSYIEVNHTNLEENNIGDVKIKFQVNKTWLGQNDIDAEDVVMLRYVSGWNELETKIIKEDKSAVYYEATSPGLSIYAIAARPEEVNAPSEQISTTEVNDTKLVKDNTPRIHDEPQVNISNNSTSMQLKSNSGSASKYIGGFAVLVLVAAGLWIMYSHTKKK